MSRALVLGGGGVTGIAWELGALLGMRDEGLDLVEVDLIVGTSAGAAVAAQLHAGLDLEELFARQLAGEHGEIPATLDLRLMATIFGELVGEQPPSAEVLARVGAHALATETVDERTRRAVIEHRLPRHEWPDVPLRLTAVDAETGAFTVFDASSGVSIVDAVAASCAVPGIWPPVSIRGRRYIDGGVRSPTCADLAAGADEVVVLGPLGPMGEPIVRDEAAALRAGGARVAVIGADAASLEAIGPNPLDPDARPSAATAGRRQGREAVEGVRAALG